MHEVVFDVKVLLIDSNSFGIRPIADAQNQYARCFADFFCFLLAFRHEARLQRLLTEAENDAIALLEGCTDPNAQFHQRVMMLWKYCCSSALPFNRQDLIVIFIKFQGLKCINVGANAWNFTKPSAGEIEKITSMMMYFCRLYHVARVKFADGSEDHWRTILREMVDITADQTTPLKRLFFLKGRAKHFAEGYLIRMTLFPTSDLLRVEMNGRAFHVHWVVEMINSS